MFRFLADPDLRDSFHRERLRLTTGALAVLGRGLLGLAGPYFLGRAVDVVDQRFSTDSMHRTVLLLLVFALLTAFCQFWMRWIWIGWSRDAELLTRNRLFAHLLKLPISFFDRSRIGDLMSRLTSDVEAVRMGYGPGLMHCAATGIMTVAAVAIMLHSSPLLTALATLPLIALFFCMKGLLPRIHDRSTVVQECQSALSTRAQESFSGVRVIKSFGLEVRESEGFAVLSERFRDESLALAKARALFSCLIECLGGLSVAVVAVAGGWLIVKGQLSLGTFASFLAYLNQLMWPMIALGWTLSLFQRADASEERLQTLRKELPELLAQSDAEPQKRRPPHLRIENLSYSFPGRSDPALKELTFELAPGTLVGIVGPTASGKSTLLALLTRLYDPPRGAIFVDGHDLIDLPISELRGLFATVPQESFLFSDTIAANIAFGAPKASREDVERVAGLAELHSDLASFADGIDTQIGERGITLSGGQRQRVALARALLQQAPVLILDDALSAVDLETERRILNNLEFAFQGRSVLVISHRLSAVTEAHQVLVLDEGRITERGTHSELLRSQGLYARLWQLQRDERELSEFA